MSNEKHTAKNRQATREFLEGLSKAELRGVMDSPILSSVLMEHVEESELLTRRVSELLEDEFRELSDEEQALERQRVARIATSLAEKYSQALGDDSEYASTLAERLVVNPASAAAERLFAALRRYARVPEQLLSEWRELAQSNAKLFLRGVEIPALEHPAVFDHERETEMPAVFRQGSLSIQLDKRDEIERFVVEVSSSDGSLCGRDLKVVLVGETGEEVGIPVRLDGRKGDVCFGIGTADATIPELVAKLGPVIVPVVQTGEGDLEIN